MAGSQATPIRASTSSEPVSVVSRPAPAALHPPADDAVSTALAPSWFGPDGGVPPTAVPPPVVAIPA